MTATAIVEVSDVAINQTFRHRRLHRAVAGLLVEQWPIREPLLDEMGEATDPCVEIKGASQVTGKVIYAGKPFYLIASPCCDKFDYLYDTKGVILCAPYGGFTGRGDGSCPEVLRAASAKDQ